MHLVGFIIRDASGISKMLESYKILIEVAVFKVECNRPVIPKPVSVLLMALSLGECVGRNVNTLTPDVIDT